MRVRLLKKLAERIDGIDLTRYRVGDYLLLQAREAAILIAEGWAEWAERRRVYRGPPPITLIVSR
jgi:hypothetical protein